jgi:hypothetical protein
MSSFNDFIDEEKPEVKDFEAVSEQPVNPAEMVNLVRRFEIPAWLKAPTGDGTVESYQVHVLNFNGSMGMARVIRGLTGMFGSLNFAVVDVLIGILDLSKERKAKAKVVEVAHDAVAGH